MILKAEMTEEEWVRVLNILAQAPYVQVQPLIAKLGDQFTAQKQAAASTLPSS